MEVKLELLDQQHKRERKELQARIQALKKSVTKGDKIKKKEIALEVTKIEQELEEKQANEIRNLNSGCSDIKVEVENVINSIIPNRVSKAQKRRDKKAAEDKEREQRILEQEIENINGPTNLELKAIVEKLKDRLLSLYNIPSDGDCLYKAVSHQLSAIGKGDMSVEKLRELTAKFMRENKEDFLPFMCDPETLDCMSDEEFEKYCVKIATTNSWGGQLELRALSHILMCPIHIVQATGPESIIQGDEFKGPPLIITYHRHMLSLGEHYNSTQQYVENVAS